MLLTVFFDIQDPLFIEFLEHRGTITSNLFCKTIQSLHRSIKNKRQKLLEKGVVMFHDNGHPNVSRVTHTKRAKFKWEQLEHLSYSPDMLPCDFHVFGPMKKPLKRPHFNSDNELKDAVKD